MILLSWVNRTETTTSPEIGQLDTWACLPALASGSRCLLSRGLSLSVHICEMALA